MKSISKRIPFFLILFLLGACAKQNAGIVKQSYHDLTSHYNGYFNANEQFNTQIKSLSAGYINNYDEILSLNSYGNLADFKDQNESLEGLNKGIWNVSVVSLLKELVSAIRENRSLDHGSTFQDGLKNQLVVDAVLESTIKRKWIDL